MEQIIFWCVQGLSVMLMTVLWYIHRERGTKIDQLERRLNETREQYVHKSDLKDLKVEINQRFDKLEALIEKRNLNG